MRIEHGYTAKQITELADCSEGLVKRVIGDYNREGLSCLMRGKFGGNRRNLSLEAETAFLAPFREKAEKGQILIVSEIHKAYEELIGREVPDSTIYRLLARHDWRKLMPRSKHPNKASDEVIATSKKLTPDTTN